MLSLSTPHDNFFTRLNPLVKIAILGTTAVAVFFTSSVALLLLMLLVIVIGIRFFRIEFGRAMILVKLFILGFPALIALFVLSYLWREPTMREGLIVGLLEGLRYALRFLNLILVNFAVVLSTDPREIVSTLRALKFPHVISQIISHVITLLPRLVYELQAVVEAQRARGMRWQSMWRPSKWLPVALPVILAAMRYSEQTAVSLELRGGFEHENTALPRLTGSDWAVGLVCLVIVVASVVKYYLGGM